MTAKLVLASRSPQRRATLTKLGVAFEVRPADIEEIGEIPLAPSAATAAPIPPQQVALQNALGKARAVRRPGAGEMVIGVDTVVELGGTIYGKPAGEAEARASLAALGGATHMVHSGLACVSDLQELTATASTEVTFRELDLPAIERYLATGEWRDRAGGYAIQGAGAALVREIRGQYENVVGLPVATLLDLVPDLLA